ncbi:hypothetical protein QKV95_gp125 [Poseidoniales virus YSH_150918]|uniref:Uncharacterized protein n=1 Tax=Poseidoniales virus YSH_150918 TaxID=3071324 RepID=A0A976UBM1_9CAUD|nr:hypothetical protein QKV95_gp125 [Yangshan Harbor Poseidoniales virus]UVF62602.1 hypothetical protein [Poseidoniales virus YSH_150918]
MSWEDILKIRTTNFQRFLVSVFNIPMREAINIQAPKGLQDAISHGGFLSRIKEKDFSILVNFAEANEYEKLINYLQELFEKRYTNPEYRKEKNRKTRERYANDPEFRERQKEKNRKRVATPELRERRREQDRKRYLRNKERKKERLQ